MKIATSVAKEAVAHYTKEKSLMGVTLASEGPQVIILHIGDIVGVICQTQGGPGVLYTLDRVAKDIVIRPESGPHPGEEVANA